MLKVAFLVSLLWLRLMYDGSCTVILPIVQISIWACFLGGLRVPKGPLTSTILASSVTTASFFFCAKGSRIWSSTSAGSDNGAPPIRDLHFDVLENDLDVHVEDNAGTRKSGSSIVAPRVAESIWVDLMIMIGVTC